MDNRVYLQPAYILHKQPFQNTSLLIDFFSLNYGRFKAVAKGARRPKSRNRSLLQLFHPLLISFVGKGEVKTVTAVESSLAAIHLQGERLFSGMYLNELLSRLLHAHVEHNRLYQSYQSALAGLQDNHDMVQVLRSFELSLLAELGYAINLDFDCLQREPIRADSYYLFIPDIGFERLVDGSIEEPAYNVFPGQHLLDLKNATTSSSASASSAKRVLRLALQAHLGEKPLFSRSLFASPA